VAGHHLATLFREQRERTSRKVTWRKPRSSSRETVESTLALWKRVPFAGRSRKEGLGWSFEMHGPPKPGRAKHRRRRVLGRRREGIDSFARSFGPVNPKSPRVTVRSFVSTSTNLMQVRPNRRRGERRIGNHAARPSNALSRVNGRSQAKGERIAVPSQRGQLPEDVPARRSYCRSR